MGLLEQNAHRAAATRTSAMVIKYQSGEEIRKGDRVFFHREPGTVEFVVTEVTGDPAMDWYLEEFGGGVMIIEPKVSGRVFLPTNAIDETEDLEFVSRSEER